METENTRPLFPWYKERLQTKYLKAPTNKISSVSSCWPSANVSVGDLGDCPSVAWRGVAPPALRDASHRSTQKPRRSIPKEHACFSKQMVRKQLRREYVAAVEEELKRHPLAMYPHYKDHMSPELFAKVVSVLDPDMCANGASSFPTPTADHAEEEDEEDCTEPRGEDVKRTKQGACANKMQVY